MAKEFLEIGCTPCNEACQQVGMPGYDRGKALTECETFLHQIRRELGNEPNGARLCIKGFSHDFGVYFEVICHFDTDKPESVEYAFKCEGEAPCEWDDLSKATLRLI